MPMRTWLYAVCLALLLCGCGDRAKDLYETAQFEERQFNAEHAGKLYQEILTKYPGSPYAAQAQARLEELRRQEKN
jgi:outer membrane protein assembly factor BamD (BamD/ComL family)